MVSDFICSFSGVEILFVELLLSDGMGSLRCRATKLCADYDLKYETWDWLYEQLYVFTNRGSGVKGGLARVKILRTSELGKRPHSAGRQPCPTYSLIGQLAHSQQLHRTKANAQLHVCPNTRSLRIKILLVWNARSDQILLIQMCSQCDGKLPKSRFT